MKSFNFKTVVTTLLTIFFAFVVYHNFFNTKEEVVKIEHIDGTPSTQTVFTVDEDGNAKPLTFTSTAEKVLPAVVHIKSTVRMNGNMQGPQERMLPDPFRFFFEQPDNNSQNPYYRFESPYQGNPQEQLRVGTGSGVIINEKGYIVTNNHVVANAEDLEVTLNDNRVYKANVIGTDPTTDLAVIQIKAEDLSTVPLVNSDNIKIGEWVLAVGNPMGLNSTVTAGIVSAKGRNINILKERFAVESFIQTDAAINPGNSGGALVNLDGGLIGINTAIASPTGSYAGYGFAIPANIVNKVVEDILTYGTVHRGVLGIMIRSVDGNLANAQGLKVNQGALVDSLMDNSAAADAGIKKGDVIIAVEGQEVISSPELQAKIAQFRPGDEVAITVNRDGKEKTFDVKLIASNGAVALQENEYNETLAALGAEFKDLTKEQMKELDLDGGVQVAKIYAGKLRRDTNMRDGFIITKVDGKKVNDKKELIKILENKSGGVMLEGVYENIPGMHYYAIGIGV